MVNMIVFTQLSIQCIFYIVILITIMIKLSNMPAMFWYRTDPFNRKSIDNIFTC